MKVSIVTISFNQGCFLEACICSVLEQDYPEIEYIVVDAGSTDGSREIIARYAERIAHVILEADAGPADGLNKGFAHASGEIFAFVNADDLLLPGAVRRMVEAFREHPDADVIYGHGRELDGEGKLIQRVWSTPWNLRANAYRTAVTVQPATFFTAACFRRGPGFNVENRTCWDAELFVDMALQGARFQPINSFIGAYRMYPGTVSSEVRWGTRGAQFDAENRRLFEKIMGRPRVAADAWKALGYYLYKQVRQPLVAFDKLRLKLRSQVSAADKLPPTRLVWFGGYPAHYMGEFHRRLEALHDDLFFIYLPFGQEGGAFAHERTRLPGKYLVLPQSLRFLQTWLWLWRLNPQAVLITGNFPRANLVAACWAYLYGRELYYLADSNLLDQRNLRRSLLNGLILSWGLRRVSKLLSIGSRNREFYLALCGKAHIGRHLHPLPLPHVHAPFEAAPVGLHDPFVFLVFGRLDAVKAVDRIISAYALLSEASQQRSRLLIAGDGADRQVLQAQVTALGLAGQVEFRGTVASDQAPAVFGEASALVIASHDEPWGLVVNEALSAGKPVIGPFWIGSFADLVIPGKTGLVTVDNTPEQLAAAMQQLLDDPVAADAMGQAGRAHVREQGWTIDQSLRSFARLHEQIGTPM